MVRHARRPSAHASPARRPAWPVTRTVIIAVGATGLAALAVAILGPKRIQRQFVEPLRDSVGSQAEKLWHDAAPLRAQMRGLIEQAQSESGREKLVRGFQSWIGHFRAS